MTLNRLIALLFSMVSAMISLSCIKEDGVAMEQNTQAEEAILDLFSPKKATKVNPISRVLIEIGSVKKVFESTQGIGNLLGSIRVSGNENWVIESTRRRRKIGKIVVALDQRQFDLDVYESLEMPRLYAVVLPEVGSVGTKGLLFIYDKENKLGEKSDNP